MKLASFSFLLVLLAVQTVTAQERSFQYTELWDILKTSSQCSKGYVTNQDDYTTCSELTMVKDVIFTWTPGLDETILLEGDLLSLWNGLNATGGPYAPSDAVGKRAQQLCGNEGRQQRDIGNCRVAQYIKFPMSAHNCVNANGRYYSCVTFTWSPNSPKNPPVKVPHYNCDRVQSRVGWEKGECFA